MTTIVNITNTSIPENPAPGTVIGVLSVTGGAEGETFAYALTDSFNERFDIKLNTISGSYELVVKTAIDQYNNSLFNFEDENSNDFALQISAVGDKGTQVDFTPVTVNVTNVNEAPVIEWSPTLAWENQTSNSAQGSTVYFGGIWLEDPEGQGAPQCTLLDPSGPFELKLVEDPYSNRVVYWVALKNGLTLDYENLTHHSFSVRISDENGSNAVIKTFGNTIVDLDDNAPAGATLDISAIAENAIGGALVGSLSAVDPDSVGVHTFTMVDADGNDLLHDLFEIKPSNHGTYDIVLRQGVSLDRTVNPTHTIYVKVTDRDQNQQVVGTKVQALTIMVEEPQAPTSLTLSSTTIAEDSQGGTEIAILGATDPNVRDTTFTYEIMNDPDGKFKIVDGKLLLGDNASLNYESKGSHDVLIRVTDQGDLWREELVTITVTDIDEAPTDIRFEAGGTEITIGENTSINDVIGRIIATDPEKGTLTYSFPDYGSDSWFTIDPNTGEIKLMKGVDYENFGSTYKYFNLVVFASDGSKTSQGQMIRVNIADVNEALTDATYTVTALSENAAAGTAVSTAVVVVDPDTLTEANRNFRYQLVDANGDPIQHAHFVVDAMSGAITVGTNGLPNVDVATDVALRVKITDKGGTGFSHIEDVTVRVNPVVENTRPDAPVVQGAVVELAENGAAVTTVATVQSQDDGLGGTTLGYEIVSNPGNLFTIDNAGVISFAGNGNFENATPGVLQTEDGTGRKYYEVVVRARESGTNGLASDTTTVKVYLNDVNEALTDATYTVTALSENAAAGTAVSTAVVVVDPDTLTEANRNFRYQLVDANGDPIQHAHFVVDAMSGAITVGTNGLPNVDVATDVALRVKITDKGGTGFSHIEDVTVRVNPVVENNPPMAPTIPANTTINETVQAGAEVATLSSTDPDQGDAVTFTFKNALQGSNGLTSADGAFKIINGKILVNDPTKIQVAAGGQNFTYTVVASDGKVNTEGNVTIKVNDVAVPPPPQNHAPAGLVLNLAGSTVGEYAGRGTPVGTAKAVDADGDALTYSLSDSAGGRFAINASTGRITLAGAVNFEQAAAHTIKVVASDGRGGTTEQAFVIAVGDQLTLNWRGTARNDRKNGSALDDILRGGRKGNDQLKGLGGDDQLFGEGGNDKLEGGEGIDRLYGGKGNDKLYGQGGDDWLYGGDGRDQLYGGVGRDVFVFNTKPSKATNLDQVKGFNAADDAIWLDNAIFKKLGAGGTEAAPAALNEGFFKIGSKAKDRDDFLVYDARKGVLLYDADGSGQKAAVEIAKLSKNLKLTADDFFVV